MFQVFKRKNEISTILYTEFSGAYFHPTVSENVDPNVIYNKKKVKFALGHFSYMNS